MTNLDEATRALQEAFDAKQTRPKFWSALAGDGGGTVDVTGEPGFIWCRYSADQSKTSKVFNIIAPGVPEDFPLTVGKRFPDDEYEQVLAINWTLYQQVITQNTVNGFTTGNHGESHNAADGNDPAPIDLRNIVEMRGRAQATPDLTIFVEEGQFIFGSTVKRFVSGNIDLTAAVPGVPGHRYVLVYVDGVTNALGSTNGAIVPLAVAPPIPAVTANTIPICLAQLAQNQTTIDEDNIFDWRFLWQLYSNLAPVLIGTNAARTGLAVGTLAELTRFYTTDTDKIWEVWEGAWRIVYPPPALSDSDGDATNPWTTDAAGTLTGSQNLVLDDGVSNSPRMQFVGGSNNDTIYFYLLDDAVAGDSDIVLRLAGAAGDSKLLITDNALTIVAEINSDGGAVFNENGRDADFRIEGDAEVNLLFVDAGNDRIGIGTNAPEKRVHVKDTSTADIVFEVTGFDQKAYFAHTGNIAQYAVNRDAAGVYSDVGKACAIMNLAGFDSNGYITFYTTPVNNGAPIERVRIDKDGYVGIGIAAPAAQLHVDQISTTAAIPVLYLDQADVSEEMIEFNTTIGVGNAIEAVGGKTLTTTHFIKVTLPGPLTRYIPCGTIA